MQVAGLDVEVFDDDLGGVFRSKSARHSDVMSAIPI
jgi:hypothetical protein